VNGQVPPPGKRRGEYLLKNDDGQELTVHFRNQIFGLDYPQLEVGTQTLNIVDPLKWYQWVLTILPVLLVAFGGALGGLIGMIAAWFNIRLFRQPWPWLAQVGTLLGITLLAVIIWSVLALVVPGGFTYFS
jgi:hypothetical protein